MLDKWYNLEAAERSIECVAVLDLACGSGEAAEGVQEWVNAAKANGAHQPECEAGATAAKSRARQPQSSRSGVTTAFPRHVTLQLHAADPYTGAAFANRTGVRCHTWSFADIAAGVLLGDGTPIMLDVCVCSFAAHLMDASNLFACLSQLALSASYLLILSPHKKPNIKDSHGWSIVHEAVVQDRVHARLYKSLML